jgi:hypothetical protein
VGLKFLSCLAMLLIGLSVAQAADKKDEKNQTLQDFSITEISRKTLTPQKVQNNNYKMIPLYELGMVAGGIHSLASNFGYRNLPDEDGQVSGIESFGHVIALAADMVGFGDDIYNILDKGKPTLAVEYTPISVLPRENNTVVDVWETEGWSYPVQYTYEVVFRNVYKKAVVTFRYSVIYSYNGSYNGKGQYLTAVQVIPEYVKTLFGFHVTATMKLNSIQNTGTKAKPIAGAVLGMEYTVSSFFSSVVKQHKFLIRGDGQFKRY